MNFADKLRAIGYFTAVGVATAGWFGFVGWAVWHFAEHFLFPLIAHLLA